MIESRRKGALPYKDIATCIQEKTDIYHALKRLPEVTFSMIIPDTELGYIIDLIDTD
jgi:hypothetical protein